MSKTSKTSTPGTPEHPTRRLWDDMLDAHVQKLSDKDRALATAPEYDITYSCVMATVDRMSREAKMQKLWKYLDKLKPAFEHLRSFSSGISAIAQVQANPACLIWGGVYILLTVRLFQLLHQIAIAADVVLGCTTLRDCARNHVGHVGTADGMHYKTESIHSASPRPASSS